MSSKPEVDPALLNVQQAYEHMMREQVAPALRYLGFTGTLRTFKYRSGSASGTVQWQKDARAIRAQRLSFTANVSYLCAVGRIAELMPAPATDTWWELRGGAPTGPVAASVVSAIRCLPSWLGWRTPILSLTPV